MPASYAQLALHLHWPIVDQASGSHQAAKVDVSHLDTADARPHTTWR